MGYPRAAWGIEIGAFAIKAIRLEREGEQVRVTDFAVVPQKKVLTTPDLDQDEMVRLGLGQFISQKVLENEHLVMSVPGHAAFARFAKLPPVEAKKVPDIVRFEAVQQIPFPIDDVEWDYQTFTSLDSPEIEVGIFAITRERVQHRLGLYGELGITPEALTLSPIAVYNAMTYDHALGPASKAIIYVDIGTSATDLIVAEGGRCWIRTFPLGGTHFTEAIANAFKLSYSKAEKLKLEASTSKYAKQIMQAMRPVFSDLLQDVQRSIGYYQSLHRRAELTTMIGLGSTFKIPGLRKFLGQQLQMNVLRLDEYKKITVTGREAAAFGENAVNMATAYGLALQGVGLAAIDVNLMPVRVLREALWQGKTKWFAAAAAVIVAGAGMTLYRPISDRAALNPGGLPDIVNTAISTGEKLQSELRAIDASSAVGALGTNVQRMVDYRDIWPHLMNDAGQAVLAANPQPELLSGDPQAIARIKPDERRLVQLRGLQAQYIAPAGAGPAGRRLAVTMDVELSYADTTDFLNSTVAQWLRDHAERPGVPYRILDTSEAPISCNPELRRDFRAGSGEEKRGSAPAVVRPPAPKPMTPVAPSGGPGFGGPGGDAPEGKRADAKKVMRPGGDVGVTGGPASQPRSGPRTLDDPDALPSDSPFGPPGAGASGTAVKPSDLDGKAPTPREPDIYPPGSLYYQVPITFVVELLEQSAAAPQQAAGTQAGPEGRAS